MPHQKEAEAAILAVDVLLTFLDLGMKRLAELRKEGLITVEEQQARLDKVEAIRQKVGQPPTTPVP